MNRFLQRSVFGFLACFALNAKAAEPVPAGAAELAREVRGNGWIIFSARSEKGDWDLFLMRPDGSARRNISATPTFNEAAPQFSRDGKRLLFRRIAREEMIEPNNHGEQGVLMLANSDGSQAKALGAEGDFAWASWSPDGSELACLDVKGIRLVNATTGETKRTLPRKGFFQQLSWSPDGTSLIGVSNAFGTAWTVAKMDLASGTASAISREDNCTPDWFPDGKRAIFSNRHASDLQLQKVGWTQLWMAAADGSNRQLVYAEDGRHIYGGHVSPDGKYVLFTGNMKEDGDPQNSGAPMALMRLSDAPILGGKGNNAALKQLYPQAKSGPILTLPAGWEPCWTAADLALKTPPSP